jgi:propionate CoA-transferase
VPNVLAAQGGLDRFWRTIEQGIHNGAIIEGPLFGMGVNPDAIIPSPDQFDFYSGGGLDITCLGLGEMDAEGNVNVAHLNHRLVGPGGFIDISQNARKVVFCGTFDAKGGQIEVAKGRLTVVRPGAIHKLVARVEKITFSGAQALKSGQEVVYVTERAVFRLTPEGVELAEVAPGVDLERDILACMDFHPVIKSPKTMNPEIFEP